MIETNLVLLVFYHRIHPVTTAILLIQKQRYKGEDILCYNFLIALTEINPLA